MSTTAAIILLIANDEKTLLRILPTKRVARPKKNGSGMTKADPKPWDVPGGKLKKGETAEQGMRRELLEETGLTLHTATKVGETHIPDCKCAVFVYTIPTKLDAQPLDGVSEVAWIPCDEASDQACFRLERALFVAYDLLVFDAKDPETKEPIVPSTDGHKVGIKCKQSYTPKYASLQEAQAKEEPGSIYAEQHISGICSDECWDALTKPDDY